MSTSSFITSLVTVSDRSSLDLTKNPANNTDIGKSASTWGKDLHNIPSITTHWDPEEFDLGLVPPIMGSRVLFHPAPFHHAQLASCRMADLPATNAVLSTRSGRAHGD
ncbi:hypothetical protein PENANT_c025G10564 [Penicillium antarcticum]|uniref:Uncharacterized protein n=1 Tax=Penicillium antarcticum TaxID=416450 RepID=A0A1V6PXZ3_9EURO|nr:hypothetical protein PENANT_c025G10564 [Penicillium antarcticum]